MRGSAAPGTGSGSGSGGSSDSLDGLWDSQPLPQLLLAALIPDSSVSEEGDAWGEKGVIGGGGAEGQKAGGKAAGSGADGVVRKRGRRKKGGFKQLPIPNGVKVMGGGDEEGMEGEEEMEVEEDNKGGGSDIKGGSSGAGIASGVRWQESVRSPWSESEGFTCKAERGGGQLLSGQHPLQQGARQGGGGQESNDGDDIIIPGSMPAALLPQTSAREGAWLDVYAGRRQGHKGAAEAGGAPAGLGSGLGLHGNESLSREAWQAMTLVERVQVELLSMGLRVEVEARRDTDKDRDRERERGKERGDATGKQVRSESGTRLCVAPTQW